MADLPRFLTTTQVAEMLAVTVDKIVDLIHSGQLPAVNVALQRGGKARWRISATDLENFLATRRSSPPQHRTTQRRKERDYTTKYY